MTARLERSGDDFQRWMHEVDAGCWRRLGVSIIDLADQPFRDFFDSGLGATEVVEQVVVDEGLEDWA